MIQVDVYNLEIYKDLEKSSKGLNQTQNPKCAAKKSKIFVVV